MPLTDDELQHLQNVVHVCDGEPWSMLERFLVPPLNTLSEGELWAMAGMFVDIGGVSAARFIASYARAVMECDIAGQSRPDPVRFLAEYRAKEAAYAAEPPPPF